MINQAVIDQALGELGVLEAGSSANAIDSASALTTLNQMMSAWAQNDKDFNWFAQDDLSATCPIPDWAEEGLVSNLAIKLSAPFRSPVTIELAAKAAEGEETIVRALINYSIEPINANLPYGTGQTASSDIING